MVPERQSTIILGTLGRAFSCRTTQRCLPAGASGGPRICWVSRPNRYSHESRGVKRSQRGLAGSARGQIGFVGLGNMGSRMATNLIRKGHDVLLFDVDQSKAASLAASDGGNVASSLRQLAQESSSVITMLRNTAEVETVYLGASQATSPAPGRVTEASPVSSTVGCKEVQTESGPDKSQGLLDLVQPGTLLVDSSTIDPNASKSLNAAAAARGMTMLDAPVSGGVPAASDGTLTFIVGGTEEGIERARPLLMSMGTKVLYCGGAGSGCIAKVCNNLCLAISMVAVSEAMSLGSKMGMDPAVLASVLNSSSARCWSSEVYNPYPGVVEAAPSSRGFNGGFAMSLMEKDLHLALQAARASSQSLPMGALAHQLYTILCNNG
ncbi:unnamed protein product [Ascophyllum nodosum]